MEEQIRQIAREEAERLLLERLIERPKEFITLAEVKTEFDLFGATLYRYINRGEIHLYKRGGKSFLKRSEVEGLFTKVR
jgi:hypothetical protein